MLGIKLRYLAPLVAWVGMMTLFYVGYHLDADDVRIEMIEIVGGVFLIMMSLMGYGTALKYRHLKFREIFIVSIFPLAAIFSVILPINAITRLFIGNITSGVFMAILWPIFLMVTIKSYRELRDA